MKTDPERFIRANTSLMAPPHVPEIRLHLASEAHELWLKTEEELEEIGLPPPFWAFAWAGGQGLARYILDHPETVAGRTVLDFASGSGLVAIAASRAGASHVLAVDIDPWARTAIAMNGRLNGIQVGFSGDDVIGTDIETDILLAGEGLQPSSKGARVKFSGSSRSVTDGPFAETKELIAGFWLWQVKSMDEAIEWVKRCPNPFDGESEIEIRQVFEADDFGAEFTPELREQEARLRAQVAAKS